MARQPQALKCPTCGRAVEWSGGPVRFECSPGQYCLLVPIELNWITSDGRALTIQEMSTTHLRNSIAKIRRSIRSENGVIKGRRIKFLKHMVEEIERRGRADKPDLNPARVTNRFRNLDLD